MDIASLNLQLIVLDCEERTHATPWISVNFDFLLDDVSHYRYLVRYICGLTWVFQCSNKKWCRIFFDEGHPLTIYHDFCLIAEVLVVHIQIEDVALHVLQDVDEIISNCLSHTQSHLCHQWEILHDTNLLTFRGLRRTNETKMSIVQQPWLCRFRTWLNGSNDSSEMGKRSKETGIPLEHLSHTRSDYLSCHWFTPITSSQSIS